jgi:hypothetical protein
VGGSQLFFIFYFSSYKCKRRFKCLKVKLEQNVSFPDEDPSTPSKIARKSTFRNCKPLQDQKVSEFAYYRTQFGMRKPNEYTLWPIRQVSNSVYVLLKGRFFSTVS